MTYRQRLLADRLLAAPVAFLCTFGARIAGSLLRRDHSVEPANVHHIVVAKLVGMGSAIQATVLLRSIKQRFPNSRLIFVSLRANSELLSRLDYVDETIYLDDRNVFRFALATVKALASLVCRRIDLYFDLEVYSAFASLLALWSLARNRIGLYRHSNRFKQGIYTHLVYFNTRIPARMLYLQMGRVVGTPVPEHDSLGPLRVEQAEREGVRSVLTSRGAWPEGTPYIVVNPNASELLLERRWPAPYVVRTVTELASLGHRVVLTGSPAEAPYVAGLYQQVPQNLRDRVVDTAGSLTLGELLALMDQAACVLTNDTGPMHMSIALRRPTVCLFGPGSPDHYGFEQEGVVNLYAAVLCSPCVHEIDTPPCQGDNVCMQRLEPQLVVESLLNLLDEQAHPESTNKSSTGRSVRLPLVTDGPHGQPLGFLVRASVRKTVR